MQIINMVRQTIKRHRMFKDGDRVVVAVSGGPDSVFLLHALNYLKREFGITLCIANLDHGIRGLESARDSIFVKRLAKKYGIPLFFKRIVFKKTKGLSLEETARIKRYGFFKSAALRKRAGKVATAHTADDMAETILMRIIKGASVKGIAGIPPKRPEGTSGMEFVRPLIELEKKDILDFLHRHGVKYRVDSTNSDTNILRNAVRNEVLPYLEKFNLRVRRALVNLGESAREDAEFIKAAKDRAAAMHQGKRGEVSLFLKDIAVQPKAIQKEITRDAFIKTGSDVKKFNFRHWKDIHFLITAKPSGKSLDLPGRVRLTKTKDRLTFIKL